MKSDWDTANLCDERQSASNFHIKPETPERMNAITRQHKQTKDAPYLSITEIISNIAPTLPSVNINDANQLSHYIAWASLLGWVGGGGGGVVIFFTPHPPPRSPTPR